MNILLIAPEENPATWLNPLGAVLPDDELCLLPLTASTRGILNAHTLAILPRGATVINLARGGHIIDDDLLDALDTG